MKLKTAICRLKGLSERWEETDIWHEPPFMDGEIHITTGDLLAIHTLMHELDTDETGLKYADGKPICEGDTIVLWHDQESSRELTPFERTVEWSKEDGAYMAVCNQHGHSNFLAEALRDVNCRKVTKKI